VFPSLPSLLPGKYSQEKLGAGSMGLFRQLKKAFLVPFSRSIPTVLVGSVDQWALPVGVLKPDSFIVCAGVGTSITFEEDLAAMFRARIVLLDPSPTGLQTMTTEVHHHLIEFSLRGLAKRSGDISFGLPDRPEEGSFKKGVGLTFPCVSLPDLLRENKKSKIDLLKIDVEGFEYEIIASMIENNIQVDILCVEIHHNKVIEINETIADAAKLILRLYLNGYVIVYNKNMDFTFVRNRISRPC
jgi:FkbM family methyltransferase